MTENRRANDVTNQREQRIKSQECRLREFSLHAQLLYRDTRKENLRVELPARGGLFTAKVMFMKKNAYLNLGILQKMLAYL